ncbi:MAG: hypothetical protein Q4G30_07075 [Actinomycetaceae bacterium]|nr:hypothetical protein [Actinomycetaceae bacterium]
MSTPNNPYDQPQQAHDPYGQAAGGYMQQQPVYYQQPATDDSTLVLILGILSVTVAGILTAIPVLIMTTNSKRDRFLPQNQTKVTIAKVLAWISTIVAALAVGLIMLTIFGLLAFGVSSGVATPTY